MHRYRYSVDVLYSLKPCDRPMFFRIVLVNTYPCNNPHIGRSYAKMVAKYKHPDLDYQHNQLDMASNLPGWNQRHRMGGEVS